MFRLVPIYAASGNWPLALWPQADVIIHGTLELRTPRFREYLSQL